MYRESCLRRRLITSKLKIDLMIVHSRVLIAMSAMVEENKKRKEASDLNLMAVSFRIWFTWFEEGV